MKYPNAFEFVAIAKPLSTFDPVVEDEKDSISRLVCARAPQVFDSGEKRFVYQLVGVFETRKVPGEPYTIKVGDRFKTNDGRDARIVATDMRGPYPVVALVDNGPGQSERCCIYQTNGTALYDHKDSPLSLVLPASEPTTVTKLWTE
jgi:hypothetical protein